MNMAGDNFIGGDKLPEIILPREVDDRLAEYTLEGDWTRVVEMYRRFPKKAPTVKIRDSVGTALHLAIELAEEVVVEELVKIIVTEHEKEAQRSKIPAALMVTNDRGGTPLHVAASRGLARICRCIVGGNGERVDLVTVKNNEGETPLFHAAVTGRETAFAYLVRSSESIVTRADHVRKDGDSILHLTIRRDFFDLAIIILHYHPHLATDANNKGMTPLAVLATRPTAFRSGSRLSWWRLILYHCIHVEPLDVGAMMNSLLSKIDKPHDGKKWPMNYDTICSFLKFFKATLFALREISTTKTKHRRSGQLMEALMKKPYEAYYGTGGQPASSDLDTIMNDDVFHRTIDAYLDQQGEPPTDGNESEISLRQSPSTEPPLEDQSQKKSEGAKPNKVKKTESQNDSSKSAKSNGATEADESEMDSSNSEVAKSNEVKKNQSENNNSQATEPDDETKSPFLLAARNGIVEMVTMIFSRLPSAIHDTTDIKKKNVLLVAVSNRQTLVVKGLKEKLKWELLENLTHAVDADENTVLHLAAQTQGEEKFWQIAGSALQMMWDIKWYEYIREIVPHHFNYRSNNKEKTAGEIFKKSHMNLVKQSSNWLKETSESCSVVAALVAGVSFATAGAVPGGTNNGRPFLEGQPAFDAFAVSTLIGLYSSVTGLIMFLAILTSRKEARDFRRGLPLKLLLGLSSLFVSIVAMFVSFCTGHFYIVNHKYRRILFPFYAATSLPVAFYAIAQFPLYFDLLTAILTKVPRGRDKAQHL